MNSFSYEDGSLFCEQVSLKQVAAEIGTPFYVYSAEYLTKQYQSYADAFGDDTLICFAVKACSNIGILGLLGSLGSGADIVSGGELFRALKAGINPQKIVYAGVGKTADEMAYALKSDVLMFNVESEQELRALSDAAYALRVKARVALRVNPNVDAKTHPYISTGLSKNKFGIAVETVKEQYLNAASMRGIEVVGVHCHIGSQLTDVSPFADAAVIMAKLIKDLKAEGINIKYLDMGGGLGISYDGATTPTTEEYAAAIKGALKGLDLKLILEPGRNIAGNSGALVTKVLYTKDNGTKKFKVVDAAMNDLARPSLYDAYHCIIPIVETEKTVKADVVGPICESGDFLARDREIADVSLGGLYAVMSAGAYGMSMSSNYNSRPRVAEVLVDGENYYIIRRRETYEDLTGFETVPTFIKSR